ncbi:hypothetical protein [Staphylococcus lutrae]|uniref:TPR repeat-containing protein n=1 Tax=Staphylococcus lutrae TaxID=155085 RepID=A0AAC9RMV6_9STAP|nr:hypothetical protein [Staphylococcus lutrae]ARJ49971.1 hypothetical protein B5P37_00675 [Staphylococcus lutrae]PNZ38902.1 hypothetical protein CD134_03040 [Staphylococcus lutrae]
MSEIIPFPKLKEKLVRDIMKAMEHAHYENAYDAFNAYERHFELTSQLAILKCEVLWELDAYFELKEETHILMRQGFTPYDTLMIYYIKSLYALGQYRATVDMVEQVIDEVNAHETRLALLPLKDQAQAQLDARQDLMVNQLQRFGQLSHYEQTQLLLTLIDDNAFQFSGTVAFLLENEALVSNIQSLMLEYLRFAQYPRSVTVDKSFCRVDVVPAQLKGIEKTDFKIQLMPQIVKSLETQWPSLVQEAHMLLNTHNIALYPIDLLDYGSIEMWQCAYASYFQQLMGVEGDNSQGIETILKLINSLNT